MPASALAVDPVAAAAREGLSAPQKTLPPWLFYDAAGSELFERITELPEYYLTRTERGLLEAHADEILLDLIAAQSFVELGAGTATKTGVLLRAATRMQNGVVYQPIDISPSALEAARDLEKQIPGVVVRPQVANYITESYRIEREPDRKVLALYIGSSIGNFSPADARGILAGLRRNLHRGDALLLGTDLAPGPGKPVDRLIAAYDDAQGVTAAFNRNILLHLNRELGTNFRPECFGHRARWNAAESRMEMHLESLTAQTVAVPANSSGAATTVSFRKGETIHTENSYKFTEASLHDLLSESGFATRMTFRDPDGLYALTLAEAAETA